MAATLSCAKCAAPLPAEIVGAESAECPKCRRWLRVVAFPALLSDTKRGSFGDRVLVEGESTCFYHAEKKAAVVCDGCGRFLCALCDIQMGKEHLCPGCLEAGRGDVGQKVEPERTLYEDLAFGSAALGLLIGPFGVVPALIALFLAIRHWKKPEKVGAWPRVKKVAAVVLALAVLVIWGSMLVTMFGWMFE